MMRSMLVMAFALAGCAREPSVPTGDAPPSAASASRPSADPPPPPSSPPPAPSLLDEAYGPHAGDHPGPRRKIAQVGDPLEAMFIYVLQDYASWKNVHKCIASEDGALRQRLSVRFGPVYPRDACGWKDGGVVLLQSGDKATFIDAQVDCVRRERVGFCAGAAGATYGNLGADHSAYRLRPTRDGWEIEKLGFTVVS